MASCVTRQPVLHGDGSLVTPVCALVVQRNRPRCPTSSKDGTEGKFLSPGPHAITIAWGEEERSLRVSRAACGAGSYRDFRDDEKNRPSVTPGEGPGHGERCRLRKSAPDRHKLRPKGAPHYLVAAQYPFVQKTPGGLPGGFSSRGSADPLTGRF